MAKIWQKIYILDSYWGEKIQLILISGNKHVVWGTIFNFKYELNINWICQSNLSLIYFCRSEIFKTSVETWFDYKIIVFAFAILFFLPIYWQFFLTNIFSKLIVKCYINLNFFKSATLISCLKIFKGTKSSQRGRHDWLCKLICNYFVNYLINSCEIKWIFL